jgi:pimeloyl-ACP methyl ester carboxylesterase
MTTSEQQQQARNGAYLEAGGVRTYHEVSGHGDPLVLLHGGMCTLETFDGLTAVLAERYRVHAPERRGHGRTPDVEGPITYAIMAEDTIAFMEAAGIGPAHLVGWSDGAFVALLVALRRPELVRKLVLIGQFVNADGVRPELKALDGLTADMLPPVLKQLYAAVSPDGPDHFEVVFEKLSPSWLGEADMELAELSRVSAPTLVLLGDDDLPTIEHAEAMRRALPAGRLGVVPGATHGLPMEQPELTGRLVLGFLAGEQPVSGTP